MRCHRPPGGVDEIDDLFEHGQPVGAERLIEGGVWFVQTGVGERLLDDLRQERSQPVERRAVCLRDQIRVRIEPDAERSSGQPAGGPRLVNEHGILLGERLQ
jgi:hypothetical protein